MIKIILIMQMKQWFLFFDIQHEQFGNELVLEDGRISEVHTPFKRIKGR